MNNPPSRKLAFYSWVVLAYTIAVILWGAYVRATGSGAGCGNHWPLCNGEVIPRPERVETLIEFTHRLMTGLLLPLVLALVLWTFRAQPKGTPARRGALWSVAFLVIESLIGAGLVRFDLVAGNTSMARAASGAIHLVNTFLLLASLTLTAWWLSGGRRLQRTGGAAGWALAISLAGVLLLGASGAVAALGDTLFPAQSLATALRQDLSPTAHFLIRLRLFHPVIAVSVGLYTAATAVILELRAANPSLGRSMRWLIVLIGGQLGVGLLNVSLLAPVWLQILHLLMADLVWVALILYVATYLSGLAGASERESHIVTRSTDRAQATSGAER